MSPENPFITGYHDGKPYQAIDVDTRLMMVKKFTLSQCEAALEMPSLQKTVQRAILSRIRKLKRKEVKGHVHPGQ